MAGVVRTFALLALLGACGRLGFGGSGSDGSMSDASGSAGSDASVCESGGHDEDQDGVADNCDLCPHVPDPQQNNSDGDGLGDECDPRPNMPGDKIIRFDPFTSQLPDLMAFATPPATQLFNGESIIIDARGSNWAGFFMLNGSVTADTFIVGGTQGARGTAGQELVSLIMAKDPAKYFCQQSEPGPSTAYTTTDDGVDYTNVDLVPLGSVPTGAFTLTLQHTTPTHIACFFNGTRTEGTKAAFTPASVSLNVIDEAATLDWFIQIRSE